MEFNLQRGLKEKRIGQERAKRRRQEWFDIACPIALKLGYIWNWVSMDDVHEELDRLYEYKPSYLGKAAGRVFCSDRWKFVGYVKSRRVSSHARPIKAWRLIR